MTQFVPFSRDQAFLPPPDAKDRRRAADVAHVVVAAMERVPLGAVGCTAPTTSAPHPRRITEPLRVAMQARLESPAVRDRYARRKKTVERVCGIIRSALGFTRLHLRSLARVTAEWTVIALAYNRRRLHSLQQA